MESSASLQELHHRRRCRTLWATALIALILTGCATEEQPVDKAPVSAAVADIPEAPTPAIEVEPEPPPPPAEPMTRVRLANGFVEGALLPREAATAAERETSQGSPVAVFRGIPYAQPPLGELRFRPPKPARRWQGSRLARQFAPACWVESEHSAGQEPTAAGRVERSVERSEDCLYVNVWTAARSTEERRPVMVVVHSGDATTGDAGHWIYDGQELARRGAVVVSFNYRLGVLGFLAHPALSAEHARDGAGSRLDRSGNNGLLDQVAALRWVKLNIAAFGGDPNRVTVVAHGRGASYLRLLLISPLARGLLQRAVAVGDAPIESLRVLRVARDRTDSKTVDSEAGMATNGDAAARRAPVEGPYLARSGEMSSLSAEELGSRFLSGFHTRSLDPLDTLRQAKVQELLQRAAESDTFTANVDGWVLPRRVADAYRTGDFERVPLLLGWSEDLPPEPYLQPGLGGAPFNVVTYRHWLASEYGDLSDDFFGVYGAATDSDARTAYVDNVNDRRRAWPMRTWARWSHRRDVPSYLFLVSRVPSGAGEKLRASEILYGMGSVGLRANASPIDQTLSKLLSQSWYEFAHSGDPNGAGDAVQDGAERWTEYEPGAEPTLQFGDSIRTIELGKHPHFRSHRLDVFDTLFELKQAGLDS